VVTPSNNAVFRASRVRRKLGDLDVPFILVTGQSDYDSPRKYQRILENKNLMWWFGQNGDLDFGDEEESSKR